MSKSFHGLSLSCASRSVWVSTITKFHSHHKSEIALVSQWSVDKLGCISLVLVCVVEEGVTHTNFGLLLIVNEVSELLVPHPVGIVLSIDNSILKQEVNHLDIMDDVEYEGFQL